MRVSIVIPAYNCEATIDLAVSAALAQEPPDGCDVEVIVVDDGSTDATAKTVRAFPVKLISQQNAGPAAARNAGWRASHGGVVAFTDSDCVPEKSWLNALMDGFKGEGVGAVTGSYTIANADRLLANLIHEEILDRHTGYPESVKFFGSYNVAIKREVLEETGGFDEGYRRASGEDNDLSYRVLRLGRKISFAPGALVAHHHTTSLAKYLREQYTHGYWRMKLYRDHPGMAGGDDYTRIKDVVEPPLAMASLASMLLLPSFPAVFGVSTLLLLLLQVPAAVRIVARRARAAYLALAFVTFARGYARGLGMSFGFLRFFLRLSPGAGR